ncbi:motility associated factor glycosyltransferase family protein [Marispirochaeta aestuarii]|uniref:motility associated factor glycosyltransferase family protein n=1 Tax=Marispirochaeta aestuarii TaxID=1963862 RepID=UPI001301EF7E|nr:6-hydroxymethylpterin diphosphokinase MptE-like protein [Marispirochaeta aestuarii]
MKLLEANLSILGRRFPEIARRVLAADPEPYIRFSSSKNGLQIVYETFGEREYPLHSTIDPSREARRLLQTAGNSGFTVVYGLGAAWHLEEFLNLNDREVLLIIDGPGRLRSFLSGRDYRKILEHPRFKMLLDPGPEELTDHLVHNYLPGLHGGFSFICLPALSIRRRERYEQLKRAADLALNQIRNDFSVQAHFGLLWSRNCIANLAYLQDFPAASDYLSLFEKSIKKAILVGAGPSLREDRELLLRTAADSMLIAVDTALPFLQQLDLKPDLVVSIDSQYYTLLHAMQPGSLDIPWAVTLSAPPALLRSLKKPFVFAGGIPLELALARKTGLPIMDTGGGNVLQAALSLALSAGMEELTVFGVDYSQPGGIPYAPATYVDRWFRLRETRTSPFLAQSLGFTFEGRRGQEIPEYNRLYPCPRLDRYRDNMAAYLKTCSGKLKIHGVSAPLLATGSTPSSGAQALQVLPTEETPKPSVLLREISEELRNNAPGTVQLLYPLISFLRKQRESSVAVTGEIIEEARSLFLKFVSLYAGE